MWWLWWGYAAFWATVIYTFTRPTDPRHHLRSLPGADNVVDATSLFLEEQRRRGS